MNTSSKLFACLAFAVTTVSATAQGFEEPPTLDAATILRPEYAQGPYHKVRAAVPTYAGHNQYVIDSEFGTFEADGNTMLMQRVGEIYAIAKLRSISRTDQYKEALKAAARSPVTLAKNLATQPVKTITGVPKGLWKMMNRVGQSAKEAGENRERSQYEDSTAQDLIGFSKAKRDLAAELGIDPYSSNEVLQQELNGISWAAFGGKITLSAALAPVGGAVMAGVNISDTATKALRDVSPLDLRKQHLATLLALHISREDAVAFLNNTAYSPTHAFYLVEALEHLDGVATLSRFIRLASEASDEADALFFTRTAQVLARVHHDTPLAGLGSCGGFPMAIAKDGTIILALEWDYACWTERAAQFVDAIKNGKYDGWTIAGYRVVLTGVASPMAKQALAALKVQLVENALPGPLR